MSASERLDSAMSASPTLRESEMARTAAPDADLTPPRSGRQRHGSPSPARDERTREVLTFWLYRVGERIINTLPRGLALAGAAAVGNLAYDLAGAKQDLIHAQPGAAAGPAADRPPREARRAARVPQLRRSTSST